MSNPAVISGCSLLPSIVGRSSSLGLRARQTFADLKGTAQGVGLLISSSENAVHAKFAEFIFCEVG
jgi:hypothetical protein